MLVRLPICLSLPSALPPNGSPVRDANARFPTSGMTEEVDDQPEGDRGAVEGAGGPHDLCPAGLRSGLAPVRDLLGDRPPGRAGAEGWELSPEGVLRPDPLLEGPRLRGARKR